MASLGKSRPAGSARGILLGISLGISALLVALPAELAKSAPSSIPAAPTQWVTDGAGFLSPSARAELDARLAAYAASNGHQILVWIGVTTGDVPIEDWAVRAFSAWRVGRRGIDDGIVLFIMAQDRKVRIEVGYGLEDRLPDARASAIIQEVLVPKLRAGDRDGATRSAVDAILAALGGVAPSERANPEGHVAEPLGWAQLLVAGLLGLLIIGFLITHPGLAILLLTTMTSGQNGGRRGGFGGVSGVGGGGWGGGGGGFSGGGGRSGGGGASGSW